MNKTYTTVGGFKPGKSVFNLSYEKKFDGDMGYLYPVLCEEVVPGDTWKIGNQLVVRFNPTVAPIMHEMNARVHYFFVPSRLLMLDKDKPEGSSISAEHLWDKFITGGEVTDKDTLALEGDAISLPRWRPTTSAGYGIGTLWDYFGFPTGVQPNIEHSPLSFCKRAYNFVWNEYYRDENLQDEVDLDSDVLLKVDWEKDYFTSALPWQQKGVAPALPVSITGSVGISGSGLVQYQNEMGRTTSIPNSVGLIGSTPNHLATDTGGTADVRVFATGGADNGQKYLYVSGTQFIGNSSNLSASTFDVADLRLATQIQKYLERNARAGSRYTSWLKAHFSVSPTDSRLDRPEYIGGSKSPVIISEVLQTSGTTDETGTQLTPQGNLAGHGLVADSNYITSYHAEEFGYIIGIMNIAPKSNYQQGINKQWLRKTKYDFYLPEFAHLSEQAIETAEIYLTDDKDDNSEIFGYQGRYNEMRSKQSMICGNLRGDLNYWHLGRVFDNAPVLNSDFLTCNPRKDIFAVPSEPGLIIDFANVLKVARPMPVIAEPGYCDHF